MDPKEFQDLWRAVQANDKYAWTRFVNCYRWGICADLRRSGLQAADADDVTNDVFIRLFNKKDKLTGKHPAAMRNLLHGIAHFARLDFLRSEKNKPEQYDIPDAERAIRKSEQTIEEVKLAEKVNAVLKQLQESDRLVLELKCIAEYDTATIADLIGCKGNAVSMRVMRAKARFREAFENYLSPLED